MEFNLPLLYWYCFLDVIGFDLRNKPKGLFLSVLVLLNFSAIWDTIATASLLGFFSLKASIASSLKCTSSLYTLSFSRFFSPSCPLNIDSLKSSDLGSVLCIPSLSLKYHGSPQIITYVQMSYRHIFSILGPIITYTCYQYIWSTFSLWCYFSLNLLCYGPHLTVPLSCMLSN